MERRECGAQKRGKPVEYCRAPAMANGRCRIHGGKSLRGIAAPQFQTGRYSKYLPERLVASYQEALDDEELLNNRHEIAVWQARLQELLERVDTGESGKRWEEVQTAWALLRLAMDAGEDITANMRAVDQAIRAGVADYAAWEDVAKATERRSRLVDREQRRMEALSQYLPVEQALAFMAAVMDVVRQHVSDRQVLSLIATDLDRLSAGNNGKQQAADITGSSS